MKILENNNDKLKLKSDLNFTVSLFMMLALGALVATIFFAGILAVFTFLQIPLEDDSLTSEIISEQQTIFLLFGMMGLGTLITALFTPLNTIYEIERSSKLFKIETAYFISLLNDIKEISFQEIKRIETQKKAGYGSIHLILPDRSINISSDLELQEDEAVKISQSLAKFLRGN